MGLGGGKDQEGGWGEVEPGFFACGSGIHVLRGPGSPGSLIDTVEGFDCACG